MAADHLAGHRVALPPHIAPEADIDMAGTDNAVEEEARERT
jgi:hypothetical protein